MSKTQYTEFHDKYTKFAEYKLSIQYIKDMYSGDVMKACEDDPVLNAYYLFNVTLRPYQIFMTDKLKKNRFMFFLLFRRGGKTTIYKIFCAWALYWDKYPSGLFGVTKIIVIAHAVKMAKSYIKEIRDMYLVGDVVVFNRFKGKLGKNFFTKRFPKGRSDKASNTTESLSLRNGKNHLLWNTIEVYPPKDTVRGDGASIMILDEVASWYKFTPDEDEVYNEAVRPVITDNDYTKIFIATTPKGTTGLSYELMPIDGHVSVYELVWFPYYVRKEPNYLRDMDKTKADYIARGKYDSFRQEFLAELVSIDNAYFKNIHITKVFEQQDQIEPLESSDLEMDFAIDFGGKKKSRTVITGCYLDKKTNVIYRVFTKRYEVNGDDTLKEDLLKIESNFPNIRKWHLDDQGGGTSFYGWARKHFGVGRLDEVTFRGNKEPLYRLFRIAIFNDRVKSFHDPDLKNEFNTFTAELKPLGKDDTDDLLDSFMLSCKDWLRLHSGSNVSYLNFIKTKNRGFKYGKFNKEYVPFI